MKNPNNKTITPAMQAPETQVWALGVCDAVARVRTIQQSATVRFCLVDIERRKLALAIVRRASDSGAWPPAQPVPRECTQVITKGGQTASPLLSPLLPFLPPPLALFRLWALAFFGPRLKSHTRNALAQGPGVVLRQSSVTCRHPRGRVALLIPPRRRILLLMFRSTG